ncbi:hypothetical protein CYLTODRAFT_489720 [Cylindrobasidium torrendii FP15055 ss-10]|uniref:Uncharacterized protein n=1 Tax=Cylindrobasidium torrendii FP15055 ss-10 TaxID=1314674 RepID=A0A0D7BEA6_9AGAR|nr:hypothetical protein CYLTODRAFT_489720 [Cylindrobasidium torrendii FP15055 ss-10]
MPPTLVAMLDERQDVDGVHPHYNHPDAPGLSRHTTITITIVIVVVAGLILLASAFHFVRRARSRRRLKKRLQEAAASQPPMNQQTAATGGYSSFFNPTGVAPTTTAPSPASPSRPTSPRTSQGREVHTTVSHSGIQSESVEGRPRSNVHRVLSWSPLSATAESPASQPSRVADRPPEMNTRSPSTASLPSPETPPPQYEALR